MSRVRHGPFCSDDELYFARRSRDFDYPVRVNGRRIGHLLPSNVRRPCNFERLRGGCDMRDFWSEGGLPSLASYRPNYLDMTPGWSQLGLAGTPSYFGDDMLMSPYDPVNTCSSSRWCPGSGIGLPCCSNMDTMMGGFFRLRNCPRGLCHSYY